MERGKIDVKLSDIQISSCFDSGFWCWVLLYNNKCMIGLRIIYRYVLLFTPIILTVIGNLDRVEPCQTPLEYNLWTAPDCAGTNHENGNRTWFHFSAKIPQNYTNQIMRYTHVHVHVHVLFCCLFVRFMG